MHALLSYRGVIDHQHGIAAANELIRLDQQFCFQRRCIPDPGSNEVMQLIVVSKHKGSVQDLSHIWSGDGFGLRDLRLIERPHVHVALG
jgi:hypothetical protein